MTQALNLALFANKLNTSGQTDNTGLQNSAVTVTAGTGMSGGGSVALGSSVTLTNAGVTSVTAGTGISVSASTGGVTITNTSSASGTVTSVATGNGLSGGTITGSGTLVVACPTFNSVGSYCFVINGGVGSPNFVAGSNYAAGGSNTQITSGGGDGSQNCGKGVSLEITRTGQLSGTWKWMSGNANSGSAAWGIACRVS